MPFTIPEHIIIMWDTTGSSIPSGWSRRTEFNDRYLRGTTGSPNSAGGGGTHTHSGGGGSHTHTYPNHSHDGSVGYSEQHILKNSPYSAWDYGATHFHPYVGASSGGGTSSTSSASTSWNAQTHNPYGRRMIFIASDGTPEAFPVNSSVFRDSSSIPEGWAQTQQNMFLYGASGDAGGTFGGSHSHSVSGTHNHTSGSHTHVEIRYREPEARVRNLHGDAVARRFGPALCHRHSTNPDNGMVAYYLGRHHLLNRSHSHMYHISFHYHPQELLDYHHKDYFHSNHSNMMYYFANTEW